MDIAVDFDGTLCTEEYPNIGLPKPTVIKLVKDAKKAGHNLILYTCREGKLLEQAIEWCSNFGLEFDAVNANLDDRIKEFKNDPRKLGADIYLDDKAYNPEEDLEFVRKYLLQLPEIKERSI